MEDFQIKEKEIIVCDRDFILRNLKLIPSEQSESEDFLKLETDWAVDRAESEHSRIIAVENPEELFEYFDGIKTIKPDRVSRPSIRITERKETRTGVICGCSACH